MDDLKYDDWPEIVPHSTLKKLEDFGFTPTMNQFEMLDVLVRRIKKVEDEVF